MSGARITAPETMAVPPGRAQDSDAGQAFIHPQPSGPIADRVAWARGEAKANRWDKGFWLGFGIRRLMGEHSGMGWYPWGGPETHITLDDLINGKKTPLEKKVANDQVARGTAASMPAAAHSFAAKQRGDEPERLVMREIGILVRLTAMEAEFPADIRVSNLNLPFDFEELPFVWVGMAEDSESLAFLIPLYAKAAGEEDKRSILWAIGLHRDSAAVVPFIERILAGKESEEIRAEAAACLGEQNDPKALELLLKTIKADPSSEVRERAVGGLVEMELPAATEALISFALNSTDRHIRSEAVRGLAEKATAATVKVLEKIATGDKDREIQEEAIHALADLPSRSGLPYLISLVRTHPEAAVRKEAVAAIGEVGGAEAVKILTELAKGRRR
ncbi:MAG: HEAT repeat domain-containing protein [Acidobacteria bacterium]|nr:HEAT repeat domain-containing protein [Acidobacteriota bacterium]